MRCMGGRKVMYLVEKRGDNDVMLHLYCGGRIN